MKRRTLITAILVVSLLLCSSAGAYAATIAYMNVNRQPDMPAGVTATDAMTFGKTTDYVYILKHNSKTKETGIAVYKDKKYQNFINLGKRGTPEDTDHANGITYYNSNLYVVTLENYILKIKLNSNELTMHSKNRYYITDMNKKKVNKRVAGIAYMTDGAFMVRYPNQDYVKVKFNVTEGTCVEKAVYNVKDTANRYSTGQDIGYKEDASGSYMFFITFDKKSDSNPSGTNYKNKIVKYRINGTTLEWTKTIDLNRTGSQEVYEVEGVDFADSGRMYFCNNEKIRNAQGSLVKDDWVRYYQ